jgi:predicted transcriptional regulator
MCRSMISKMFNAQGMAKDETPEIHSLFEEWAAQMEQEIRSYVKEAKTDDVEDLAVHFNLSRDSIAYFLNRMTGTADHRSA